MTSEIDQRQEFRKQDPYAQLVTDLGFRFNPFPTLSGVYAVEAASAGYRSTPMSLWTETPCTDEWIKAVLAPETTFVFGEPGTGKSALLNYADYRFRTTSQSQSRFHPLPVVLDSDNFPTITHAGLTESVLEKAIAIAYTVRGLEEYNTMTTTLSDEVLNNWRRMNGNNYRIMRGFLEEVEKLCSSDDHTKVDISDKFLTFFDRPGVKYISASSSMGKLARAITPVSGDQMTLRDMYRACQQAGFTDIFVFVDNTFGDSDPEIIVSSFLELAQSSREMPVHFKSFFSPDKRALVQANAPDLSAQTTTFELKWTKDDLKQLLSGRLKKAGSHLSSLEPLIHNTLLYAITSEQRSNLTDYLVALAQNNPRNLVMIVAALLLARVEQGNVDINYPKIDTDTWNRMTDIMALGRSSSVIPKL